MKQGKLLIIALGSLLIVLVISLWIRSSNPFTGKSFITVEIPSPNSFLPNGDWIYSKFSTKTREDGRTYYVWRRETSTFSDNHPEGYDLSKLGEIERYFIDNLAATQWVLDPTPRYDHCTDFIPELSLVRYENWLLSYNSGEKSNKSDYPVLCVFSWRDDSVEDYPKINSILTIISD